MGWSSTVRSGALAASVVVGESSIGLTIARRDRTVGTVALGIGVDGTELGSGSTVVRSAELPVVEEWLAHSGKARGNHLVDHRELRVELHYAVTGRDWVVRVRVSADGVAVRYALPELQGTAVVTSDHIDGRYSGAHGTTVGTTLRFQTAEAVEVARGDVTPWRVFVVGELADIVESLFVDELAPAVRPELVRAEWIRPGRAAWSWWSDFYSGAQLEQQKRFVDAAAELSWEHLLIDCGWEETWVPEIVSYASRRGIQVHLWTVWHDLDGPGKLGKLALWRSWGVAGIKVDFMESESKDRYRWYDSVLQETARLGLMVNFHGSVIPRGWARTWPHVIGYEAIRGSEYYVFYNDTPLTAEHNVIQPFTRNVVGAMDYTPVGPVGVRYAAGDDQRGLRPDPVRDVSDPRPARPAAHTMTTVSSVPRGRCIRCPLASGKYPATLTKSRRVTGRVRASVTSGLGTTTIR